MNTKKIAAGLVLLAFLGGDSARAGPFEDCDGYPAPEKKSDGMTTGTNFAGVVFGAGVEESWRTTRVASHSR
jgi:hypothetical protein